ncbi:MAG: hypothetical protein ACO1NO_07590 [Burkholderiaceae bacterium]
MSSQSNEDLIEQLRKLEYSIRQSITVREDQEEDADPVHTREAERLGIAGAGLVSKGDLLNAVQTALRATTRDSRR